MTEEPRCCANAQAVDKIGTSHSSKRKKIPLMVLICGNLAASFLLSPNTSITLPQLARVNVEFWPDISRHYRKHPQPTDASVK